MPNLPADDLPEGDSDEDAELVGTWGAKPVFEFEPADHVAIGERLGILDFARATKLSGPRFAVARGAGARLERAIADFLLDLHAERHGYTEFSVPAIVSRQTMTGTGQLPKFEADLFRTGVADRDLYLIPTAEVPLTNLHANETLRTEDLPLAYTADTPCFRSEAGSDGRDTKGLIRVHQFRKVELVRICDPARADDVLALLRGHAEACLRKLGLAYRVVKLAVGDTGFSARRPHDLEACCRDSSATGRSRASPTSAPSRRAGLASVSGRRTELAASPTPSTAPACRSAAPWPPSSSSTSKPTALSACLRPWCPTCGSMRSTPTAP